MKHYLKRVIETVLLLCVLGSIFYLGIYHEYRNQLYEQENFYEKLIDGYDVKILIVGDSISQGAGATDDDHRWPFMLEKYIEETYKVDVTINNVSLGGNTSYAGYVMTRNLWDGDTYDLAIVCFAENDKEEDFDLYYESVLRAINQKCPRADIISILESSQREYTNKIQQIIELSEYYGAEVVDTIEAFNNSDMSYEQLSSDGVHPSDEGHNLYCNSFKNLIEERTSTLIANSFDFIPYIQSQSWKENSNVGGDELVPLRAEVTNFKNSRYLSLSKFISEDGLHYVYDIDVISGGLGIDYTYYDEDSQIQILVDGMLYDSLTFRWNAGFEQRHIWLLTDEIQINHSIELVFESEEQVNHFGGLIINYCE